MPKQVTFEEEAFESIREGVRKSASAVKVTLGPRGRTVLIDRSWGSPKVSKDGASVVDDLELEDKRENLAARMIKEAANKTSDETGDGTTTCVVLAEAMFNEGLKLKVAGCDGMALARGIFKAVDEVCEKFKEMALPVEGKQIEFVATVAGNNDPEIGKMIARAMEKVGNDGTVTVEEGKSIETEVEVVQGMQFDRGFISPQFVTDEESGVCVLEDAYVLIHEDKIENARQLIPLLEKVTQKKPLLVIAENVEGEALAALVVNKLKGILACCAVKSPGYGERRRAMLMDIGIMTGGRAIYKELGEKLENLTLDDLGRARRVTVDADKCTIVGGYGDRDAVESRAQQIRREIETTTSDYDREKLQERLAKLTGGIAEIRAGGATETEIKEKKSRIENALNATRAAMEEGILPGGGVALVRATSALDELRLEGDERFGVEVVKSALPAPLRQLAANAGYEGGVVFKRVLNSDGNTGFDVLTGRYRDMIEAGIIDPVKVVRTALRNAASVATLLLSSETLITELPKKKKETAPAHSHPHF